MIFTTRQVKTYHRFDTIVEKLNLWRFLSSSLLFVQSLVIFLILFRARRYYDRVSRPHEVLAQLKLSPLNHDFFDREHKQISVYQVLMYSRKKYQNYVLRHLRRVVVIIIRLGLFCVWVKTNRQLIAKGKLK